MMFEKIGLSYEATKAIVLLGIGAYQSKKPFHALEQFARAQERMRLEANSSWIATLDLYQALVLQQEGRYCEALRHCRRAEQSLARIASHLLAETQLLMAALYLNLEQMKNAEKWRDTAVQTTQTLKSASHLSRVYLLSARLHEAQGADIEAAGDYRQALQFDEEAAAQPRAELSKIPHSENHLELYEGMIALGLRVKAPVEELFQCIEKVKARELSELIRFRMNALPARSRSKSALVEHVNSLRQELSWYYRKSNSAELSALPVQQDQTQGLRSIIEDQEHSLATTLGELETSDKELHSLLAVSTVPELEIRKQLSADELVVEFFIIRGLIFVCLIKQAGFEFVPVAHLHTIRREMRHLRLSLCDAAMEHGEPVFSDLQLERTMASLRALHDMLIAPLGDRLSGKRLVIVPVGPLHYLPFHALFDGEQFMWEKHLMSYSSSASLHYLSSTKRSWASPADDVAIVPEISLVSETVQNRFHQARCLKDLEAECLTHRFVHIECGIRFRRDNVLLSTISIGKDELSLLDTFHLQLPCDVLSLMGCGTGIHTDDGRELVSLSRGLEYAGARTILLPLWNGPRKSMGMFFDVFYQSAASDGNITSALRKSMAAVHKCYPHPFYWASMTLRGKIWRDGQSDTDFDSNGFDEKVYSGPSGFSTHSSRSLLGPR
jgi:CHAT domain-containing protein